MESKVVNKKECTHGSWNIKTGVLADLYTCRKCGTEKRSWQIKKEKTITISSQEYKSLLKDRDWVAALEVAGLNDWEGFDKAMELFDAYSDK